MRAGPITQGTLTGFTVDPVLKLADICSLGKTSPYAFVVSSKVLYGNTL